MKNYIETLKTENNNIIQIGSHDGVLGEEYGFIEFISNNLNNVVMIEPVPQYMEKLKNNLKNVRSNIKFIQAAIRNYDGVGKINLMGGSSTFNSEYNHLPSVETEVINISTLLKNLNFSDIDLLLLDVEGCEKEIVDSLDLKNNKINCIRWEYHILSKDDNNFIINKFKENGYNVDKCLHDEPHNMIAWK